MSLQKPVFLWVAGFGMAFGLFEPRRAMKTGLGWYRKIVHLAQSWIAVFFLIRKAKAQFVTVFSSIL
jgi:hypothetical protein